MTEASNEAVLTPEATRVESSAVAAPWRLRRLDIWMPLIIIVLDQITKFFVRTNVPLYSTVTVIPGFMNITHVLNTGAAFGILNSSEFPFKTVVIAVIATAALIGVAMYAASLGHHQLLARVGLALILGGAAGNLIDRITTGSVVDFVDVYWETYHFWAFNVADSAISVGVTVMILDMLGAGTHVSKTL